MRTTLNELLYRRLTVVQYEQGHIVGRFADGSLFTLPADYAKPITFSDSEIHLPGDEVISWSRIRELTDSEYAAYLELVSKPPAIGQRLKSLRVSRDRKLKELSKASGISHQDISRLESGKYEIHFTTLRALLRGLDCSVSELATHNVRRATLTSGVRRKKTGGKRTFWNTVFRRS